MIVEFIHFLNYKKVDNIDPLITSDIINYLLYFSSLDIKYL